MKQNQVLFFMFRFWEITCLDSVEYIAIKIFSPLRKQAYSNILENLPAKYENFQIKILIFFLCLLKNIDCGYSLEPPRRGSSNEYPQSMFWAEIWKIMYTPVNPSFTI